MGNKNGLTILAQYILENVKDIPQEIKTLCYQILYNWVYH